MTDIQGTFKNIKLESLNKGEAWPCTIVMDRYNGVYSGGKWLAFNEYNNDIPDDIGGDDPTELNFWSNLPINAKPIGKGNTPDEAYSNLVAELIKWYNKWL